jgi:hypothetical protein
MTEGINFATRRRTMNSGIEVQEVYPRKIGGWLLLYLVLMMISAAFYATASFNGILGFSDLMKDQEGIDFITTIILLIGTILKLVFSIFIFIMFITKNRLAPKTIIIFEVLCLFIRLIGIKNAIINYPNFSLQLFISIFFVAISVVWILFFSKSKRVKETFIN